MMSEDLRFSEIFNVLDYSQRYEMSESDALRVLSSMAENGEVFPVGASRWGVLNSDIVRSSKFPGNISPLHFVSWEDRLTGYYWDTERRISHEGALSQHLPMKYSLTASADFVAESSDKSLYYIRHHYEKADTLQLFADQITDKTWMSSPERAIAEIAQHTPELNSDEIIMLTFYSGYFWEESDWRKTFEICEYFGWEEGLRRIASTAAWCLNEKSWKDKAICDMLNEMPRKTKKSQWIEMSPLYANLSSQKVGYKDNRFKVLWRNTPESVFQVVSH